MEFEEPYVYYDNRWYCLNGKLTIGGQVLLFPEEWLDSYYNHNVDWRQSDYVEASNDDMAFGVVKNSVLEYLVERHDLKGCVRFKQLPLGEKAYYFWEEERIILKKDYENLRDMKKGNITPDQYMEKTDQLFRIEEEKLHA